ncbi:MAG: PH domain-containing protein, partial [Planctomycetota bacterium]
ERFEQQAREFQGSGSLDDHEPEESLWQGSYSPKAMIGSWILLGLVSIALLILPILIEGLTFGIALIVVLVLWVLVGGNYARWRLGYHYELTSQRFIHKSGIITRRTDRIEVIDIDDVSYEQGPIQRIFGVGSVHITSSDRSDPELHLNGIAKVSEVSGLIDDVRRAERRRRSLHIESI